MPDGGIVRPWEADGHCRVRMIPRRRQAARPRNRCSPRIAGRCREDETGIRRPQPWCVSNSAWTAGERGVCPQPKLSVPRGSDAIELPVHPVGMWIGGVELEVSGLLAIADAG